MVAQQSYGHGVAILKQLIPKQVQYLPKRYEGRLRREMNQKTVSVNFARSHLWEHIPRCNHWYQASNSLHLTTPMSRLVGVGVDVRRRDGCCTYLILEIVNL